MKRHEIENWALNIIDRVKAGQPVEDDKVELKSDWIDAKKAARRLAGHANAARGECILWLIGVDEKGRGVIGANHVELADWLPQVQAEFDGLAPELLAHLNIPVEDKTIVALLFETDRAPFVIKNPAHGVERGESVELEVPWRDGARTRSARRSELLRLLSPLEKLPSFEILNGTLTAQNRNRWLLELELYVLPKNAGRIVIPFHHCEASFEVLGCTPRIPLGQTSFAPRTSVSNPKDSPLTINATRTEVVIDGPGKLYLDAVATTQNYDLSENDARVSIALHLPNVERPAVIDVTLSCSATGQVFRWVLKDTS